MAISDQVEPKIEDGASEDWSGDRSQYTVKKPEENGAGISVCSAQTTANTSPSGSPSGFRADVREQRSGILEQGAVH